MEHAKLTASQKEAILERARAGRGAVEIAHELGIPGQAVVGFLMVHGLLQKDQMLHSYRNTARIEYPKNRGRESSER